MLNMSNFPLFSQKKIGSEKKSFVITTLHSHNTFLTVMNPRVILLYTLASWKGGQWGQVHPPPKF